MNILKKIIPSTHKAIYLARRQLPELVTDAVNLEGINMTLPEVQTLLDGVTVGGHKLSDVVITLNQVNAWRFLLSALEQKNFILNKIFSNELHAIAAKDESLEWGVFRNGKVTISGTEYLPPEPEILDTLWHEMIKGSEKIENIFEKSIFIFLQMTRNQFYFDVNKRMGRFMMNGLLLSLGYPVINVPAKRQLEFNELMLDFYPNNNMQPMIQFMISCISEATIEFMSE